MIRIRQVKVNVNDDSVFLDTVFSYLVEADNQVGIMIEKGIDKSEYWKIKDLNDADREKHNEIVALKMLLNSMGKCEGAVVTKDNQVISGGFITFSQKVSLITDIYTNEEYRGKGCGKVLVEKLLNLSINENVYLVSKEYTVFT